MCNKVKVKLSPLRAMEAHGDVDARVHIYTAAVLERGRVARPVLNRLYPWGKPPVLILLGAEWTPGPVWTQSEEKSPPLQHPGSNLG